MSQACPVRAVALLPLCVATDALAGAEAEAQICSSQCSAEFVVGCVPFHCERGKSGVEAYEQCRGEIAAQAGPLVDIGGCAQGCTSTANMVAAKSSCDTPGGTVESGGNGSMGNGSMGFAGTEEQICSIQCSVEFVVRCVPYHCELGKSGVEAYEQCRGEIAAQTGPLIDIGGCAQGCSSTADMVAAKSSCDTPGGEGSGGGGSSGTATDADPQAASGTVILASHASLLTLTLALVFAVTS